MYVRIKRSKTTIFLHVEPTDTVLEVKQKLQELTQQVFMMSVVWQFCSVTQVKQSLVLESSLFCAGSRHTATLSW